MARRSQRLEAVGIGLILVKDRLDKSSECSREITKIFKEIIDNAWYTWTKKHFVWDPKTETSVREAWDAKASGRYADFLRDIKGKMVKPIFMSDGA
nr:PDR ABC-type transporter family protein [Tanacetum cinerariifolium]